MLGKIEAKLLFDTRLRGRVMSQVPFCGGVDGGMGVQTL